MRPSMRLPLREARFVCSSCRVQATPRISPFSQARRYASDSPGFLERTRRKLWGTDKPPGPADPYSGSQLMPENSAEPEELPTEEKFSLTSGVESPQMMDAENLSWEEMPRLGYLKEDEWKLSGQNHRTDKVKAWYAMRKPVPYRDAARRAAVQIGLKQMLGFSPNASGKFKRHDAVAHLDIKPCKFEGQADKWGDRLRFPDNQTMESLLFQTVFLVRGERPTKEAFQEILEKLKSDGTLDNRLYDANAKEPIRDTLKSLPLTDGSVQFAFFAKLSKLTASRISDSIITASNTVGKVFSAQESLRKKTNRLNPVLLHQLMDKNGAAALPNIKIADVRQTRHHNDEDFGRKKAIVSALYENGLITKSLGKKTLPWKLRKKSQIV